MTDMAGNALVDGDGDPDPPFFDLVCQKEQVQPRAQPWKAHWSPENHAEKSGHTRYLSDEDGAALIDGGSGRGFEGLGDGDIFDLCG